MRKKIWEKVAIVTSLLSSLPVTAFANTSSYSDIANNFAQSAIMQLTAAGDIHGYANGTFQPNALITRGQFLAYLMNTLEPYTNIRPVPHGTYFPDVLPGNWDYNVIGSAAVAGWINPYWIDVRQGFHENFQASRGDAASFFVAALQHSKFHVTLPQGEPPLQYVTKLGIFSGLPSSGSQVYFTRADAAVVLENMLTICRQLAVGQPLGVAMQATGLTPSSTVASTSTAQKPIVLGFNYGGSVASNLTEDKQDTAVNTVVYDGFHLDSALQFQGSLPASFADTLHTYGKQVWGLFGSQQPSLLTAALSSTQSRTALVQQIASVCTNSHLNGANIDFEDVPANLESDLTSFMQQLTTTLHAKGMATSIDVAVPSAGSWSAAYNYGQLGKIVNDEFLMTYDQHWSGDSTPGPVASLSWVQSNLQTLLQDGVPASHLVLGAPLYTRAWQTSNPTQMHSVPISSMEAMLANGQASHRSFDASANQWIDVYNDPNGVQWEFWQDGMKTLQSIGALAVQNHLAGIGYWQLGNESSTQWSQILAGVVAQG